MMEKHPNCVKNILFQIFQQLYYQESSDKSGKKWSTSSSGSQNEQSESKENISFLRQSFTAHANE